MPHAPDVRFDHDKTRVGYQVPFNRYFYVFKPPRPFSEIDAELKGVTHRILTMIGRPTIWPARALEKIFEQLYSKLASW